MLTGLAVSRSLGDMEFKRPKPLVSADPDVSRIRLGQTDTVMVMGSDGLWDVVSDQEAVNLATKAIREYMRSRAMMASRAGHSRGGGRNAATFHGGGGGGGASHSHSSSPFGGSERFGGSSFSSPLGKGHASVGSAAVGGTGSQDPWQAGIPIPEAATQVRIYIYICHGPHTNKEL